MKNETRFSVRIFLAVILIIIGFLLAAFSNFDQPVAMGFINAGMILVVINYYYRKKGGIPRDERTVRIGRASLTASWLITFVTLNILFWLDYVKLITLSVQWYFVILFIVMLSTPHIFRLYYRNKSDI